MDPGKAWPPHLFEDYIRNLLPIITVKEYLNIVQYLATGFPLTVAGDSSLVPRRTYLFIYFTYSSESILLLYIQLCTKLTIYLQQP